MLRQSELFADLTDQAAAAVVQAAPDRVLGDDAVRHRQVRVGLEEVGEGVDSGDNGGPALDLRGPGGWGLVIVHWAPPAALRPSAMACAWAKRAVALTDPSGSSR